MGEVIAVFGTTIANNHPRDMLERANEVVRLNKPDADILCIGADVSIVNGFFYVTEAENASDTIEIAFAGRPHGKLVLVEEGVETIEQTENLINILQERYPNFDWNIVSSWHQLPRVAMMIKLETGKMPVMHPVIAEENPIQWAKSLSYLVLGTGYTFLYEMIKRANFWVDGGPVVSKIRKRRLAHE